MTIVLCVFLLSVYLISITVYWSIQFTNKNCNSARLGHLYLAFHMMI